MVVLKAVEIEGWDEVVLTKAMGVAAVEAGRIVENPSLSSQHHFGAVHFADAESHAIAGSAVTSELSALIACQSSGPCCRNMFRPSAILAS